MNIVGIRIINFFLGGGPFSKTFIWLLFTAVLCVWIFGNFLLVWFFSFDNFINTME